VFLRKESKLGVEVECGSAPGIADFKIAYDSVMRKVLYNIFELHC
jgi:hypothetical protein